MGRVVVRGKWGGEDQPQGQYLHTLWMGANRDHHKHEETDWSSVGFLRLCCYATTYTGGPPLTETRQLELPSLLDLPRGILPSLQTLLSKTKKSKKQKRDATYNAKRLRAFASWISRSPGVRLVRPSKPFPRFP